MMLDEIEERMKVSLSENNTYFEYNPTTEKIVVVRDNEYIIDGERLFSSEINNIVIDEDNKNIIKNFIQLCFESCSKEQVCFKARMDGIEKTFLLESFQRNDVTDTITGSIKNISKLVLDNDMLVTLSQRDTLTGLLTRAGIMKYVDMFIKTKSFFLFTMLDIDYFKEINDTYGHIVGDDVLEDVAKALKKLIGNDGEVGRIGGDEFVVIKAYDHSPSHGEKATLCRSIKKAVRDLKASMLNTKTLSATIGCVEYPFDGLDFNRLYQNVDKALYRGKTKGRNCYIIFNEQTHGNVNTQIPLTSAVSDEGETVDVSIFINDILNSLLAVPTKENAQGKLKQVGYYFRANRITIFEHQNSDMVPMHSWNDGTADNIPLLEIFNYDSYFEYLDDSVFIINDISEFKHENPNDTFFIPYDHGSFVFVPIGQKRHTDLFMCLESFGERRMWTKHQISSLKVIARMITTFYMKG